ncbi:MAG: phenylalanine--tRNA ligase subunit beta [Halothiobacillus sp.]
MRFSESWLREWINPPVDTARLGHRLTMVGLEVDAIEPAAPHFSGVVIAEVQAVAPHPEADKLKITRVSDGGSIFQVVCGASNVQVGMRVPLAKIGAELPSGLVIQSAQLRGITSEGMLCSATELGLPSDVDGLWALPADAPLGTSIRDWLQLDDAVIELGITPNRGDALSILGLARDCSALFDLDITHQDTLAAALDATVGTQPARIDATSDCPTYLTQVITDIPNQRKTPLWMTERLRRAGVKSIEPIVDVCNYVMLELGQPLHAFDRATLNGDLQVRRATSQEPLLALNKQELLLDSDCLVIADAQAVIALAGIIGGLDSAVRAATTAIVLESAHFTPEVIASRARRLGLSTDASFRFERGVDPALPARALARATALILDICGGKAGPVAMAMGSSSGLVAKVIELDMAWATRRLGLEIAPELAKKFLSRLGCVIKEMGVGIFQVTPPSHRFDLSIPEDLLEELARLLGFDAFRAPMGRAPLTIGTRPETENSSARIADFMAKRGYFEAITYSFIDPDVAVLFHDAPSIALANPISSEMAVMRQSLWPGLLQAVKYNQSRQQTRVRLFELGRVFTGSLVEKDLDGVQEMDQLAAVICGSRWPEQWAEKTVNVDFFDLKGDCEALLQDLGFALTRGAAHERPVVTFRVLEGAGHKALHPGQSAEILINGHACGWLGALHPDVAERMDLTGAIYVLALDLHAVKNRRLPANRPRSRFPHIRRDLALLKPTALSVAELLALIQADSPTCLHAVSVFDRYVGAGIEPGFESVAVKLIFQEFERTLTDDEIVGIISNIRAKLAQHHIQLRT